MKVAGRPADRVLVVTRGTHHEFAQLLEKFKPPRPDADLLQLRPRLDDGESALDRRWRVLKLAKHLTAADG